MSDIVETLFGPLSKEYCIWFYFLSIWCFAFLVIYLITSIAYGISKRKGFGFYMSILTTSILYGFLYFQNRLLHSMCVGAK